MPSLWIHIPQNRFFLIPFAQELNEGMFDVRALSGDCKSVDLESIVPFEITRKEAKPYIQAALNNTLSQTKEALDLLTDFAEIAQAQTTGNAPFPQPPKNFLATLLGISQKELNENPNAVQQRWQALFQGCQDVLKGATSDDPKHLDVAKARMQQLQQHLQSQGITVEDSIQDLPDKLHEKYNSSTPDPNLKVSAEKFQEATQEVSRSFSNLLQTLKEGVNKVREAMEEAEVNKSQKSESKASKDSGGACDD